MPGISIGIGLGLPRDGGIVFGPANLPGVREWWDPSDVDTITLNAGEATVTCVHANAALDTVTVGATALLEGTDFSRGATDNDCATNLAAAIDALTGFSAAAVADVVTITNDSVAKDSTSEAVLSTDDDTAFVLGGRGYFAADDTFYASQSGHAGQFGNFDLEQTTEADQLLWDPAGINGLGATFASKTNQFFEHTAGDVLRSYPTSVVVVMRGLIDNAGGNDGTHWCIGGDQAFRLEGNQNRGGAPFGDIGIFCRDATTQGLFNDDQGATNADGNPHFCGWLAADNFETRSVIIDGTKSLQTGATSVDFPSANRELRIGKCGGLGTKPCRRGDIIMAEAEFTDADWNAIGAALQSKWGYTYTPI